MADEGLFGGGAAFGVFPQMGGRRRLQDPQASADVPLQAFRGRVAGLFGGIPDLLNFKRSLLPEEAVQALESYGMIGPEVPYGSEFYLKELPLAPTSPVGQLAGQVGSFVPLNPMPAVRGAQTVGRMVGERMAENVATGRPNLPSMFAEPRSSLFAVEPNPSMAAADESSAMRQQLTGKMQALLAQKKVATSAVEVGAINQQIGELQTQFKSLPAVGRVAREVVAPQITAPVSDLGFYSAAEQAAMNLERSKGTGQSFLNDLMNAPDVKKDELSWIGLDDFLKDKPNVTKQEVQDFIAGNRIDVQEKMLGGNQAPSQDLLNWMSARSIMPPRNPEGWQELSQKLESYAQQHQKAQGAPETSQRYFTLSEEAGRISEGLDAGGSAAGATKYDKYELPGGENYREILLTLPEAMPNPIIEIQQKTKRMEAMRELQNEFANAGDMEKAISFAQKADDLQAHIRQLEKIPVTKQTENYQSSHFDQPNILAHIRVNDRVDADGKKMLLVEEIQSDWHQAGREKGYKTGKERNPSQVEKELTITTQKRSRLIDEAAALPDSEMTKFKAMNEEIKALGEQATKLNEEWTNLLNKPEGVPDAPFKDTWHQLSLKRILKYAADNGYERVGLTTGKQQIDRFSNELRQNVDEITFQNSLKLTPSETAELQALRQQQTYMTGTERARYEYLSSNEGEYVGKGETKIKAFKGSKPTFSGTVKDGKFIDGQAQGKTVEEVLGKSMAKQIAEKQTGVLKGDNLTVGGEGMKAYYDEIYPKFLEKYGKKWDAKVGETYINTGKVQSKDELAAQVYGRGETYKNLPSEQKRKIDVMFRDMGRDESIRYIDITPEMKGAVSKGQPLFAAAPVGSIGLGYQKDKADNLEETSPTYTDPFGNTIGSSIR